MGRRGYPPEFRRRVLDLVEAGRKVADLARALGVSEQAIDGCVALTSSPGLLSFNVTLVPGAIALAALRFGPCPRACRARLSGTCRGAEPRRHAQQACRDHRSLAIRPCRQGC
jgi:transposase-like protein